jgi:hypothetical protein
MGMVPNQPVSDDPSIDSMALRPPEVTDGDHDGLAVSLGKTTFRRAARLACRGGAWRPGRIEPAPTRRRDVARRPCGRGLHPAAGRCCVGLDFSSGRCRSRGLGRIEQLPRRRADRRRVDRPHALAACSPPAARPAMKNFTATEVARRAQDAWARPRPRPIGGASSAPCARSAQPAPGPPDGPKPRLGSLNMRIFFNPGLTAAAHLRSATDSHAPGCAGSARPSAPRGRRRHRRSRPL